MKPRIVQICALDSTMFKMLDKLNEKSLEEGYEIHCICSPGDYITRLENKGYVVHPIRIDRSINLKGNIQTIKNIYRLLRQLKPQIVHVHTPVAAVLGRIAAKLARVSTIIYTAHGFYFHEGMSKKEYKTFFNIEKYMGKFFTDYIFTQSEEDYQLAKKNNFLKKHKKNNYVHISNGIDLKNRFNFNNYDVSVREKLLKEHNLPLKILVITFIGRMVREKGIIDLIEAMKELNLYKDIHLFALGSVTDSERDKSMNSYIATHKDLENVTFMGKVEDVERYLYSSDLFILPSYREGMPRSIIEAMALKNAVIATNIRGSREEVVHNSTGYLVNVNSSKEIKDKILNLYSDHTRLNEFKEHGYKRAQDLYDESKVVYKQIEIFKEVTS
ncbi:glycosyltransferase family 4 protein [Salinicoccus roseus]|uniref:glycosyltransferase family 4 protein n=1 Tax=Salinicoccus roseus TaxID=45670 RepID=UPI0035683D0B